MDHVSGGFGLGENGVPIYLSKSKARLLKVFKSVIRI